VTKNYENVHLFVWPFVIVERRNGGSFLPTVSRRAEEMMLAVEVVVVVGCFVASAAPLHLGFDQNILNPP
jgi:hypothetical protein